MVHEGRSNKPVPNYPTAMDITMKKLAHPLIGLSILLSLAACNRQNEQAALQPMSESQGQPAEAVPAAIPVSAPATSAPTLADHLAWDAKSDSFKTQNAQIVEGQLVNDINKPGFAMFGPYVPFKAGEYTVSFQGRVDTLPAGKVRLDVVSSRGKVAHGGIDVTNTGAFPTFNIALPADVSDLEVRVQVPRQAQVSVTAYEVAPKP